MGWGDILSEDIFDSCVALIPVEGFLVSSVALFPIFCFTVLCHFKITIEFHISYNISLNHTDFYHGGQYVHGVNNLPIYSASACCRYVLQKAAENSNRINDISPYYSNNRDI